MKIVFSRTVIFGSLGNANTRFQNAANFSCAFAGSSLEWKVSKTNKMLACHLINSLTQTIGSKLLIEGEAVAERAVL
jgi:hypothetical protein